MVPSGATADDLTTEDTESDGQILRTYSFGGTQVGTAVVEDPSQESSSDVLENDENMVLQKLIPNPDPRSRILPWRCGHPAPYPSAVAHDPDPPFLVLVPRRIYFNELKNPSYVPVISGYIEGIFFCHLTHRGVSHKTELPGRYSIKTAKQPEVLSGPGISTF